LTKIKNIIRLITGTCMCLAGFMHVNGQGISVYTSQNLSFGAFFQGASGGSVTVSSSGTRSAGGDVILAGLGIPYYQSVFEIEASPGTIVHILNSQDVILTGSNGGTMNLHLGDPDTGTTLITSAVSPARTQVNIGGTLTMGGTSINTPGTYNGTFHISFNYE
jgi:hypothetical protein